MESNLETIKTALIALVILVGFLTIFLIIVLTFVEAHLKKLLEIFEEEAEKPDDDDDEPGPLNPREAH